MSESKSHDGETLKQAIDRAFDDLEDPFDRHRNSRGRYGWRDLLGGHAKVNVLVAWCREQPRTAGHVMAYAMLAIGAMLILYGFGAALWALVG